LHTIIIKIIEHNKTPCGEYWVLEDAPTNKVKGILVYPGGRLYYQYHQQLAEVWAMV
jgi:hypothetical protein